MPIIKSAKKELRKGARRKDHNDKIRDTLKDLIKHSRRAIEAKDVAKAAGLVVKTLKALDKAAQKGIIKKNAASRGKSRLQKRLNAIKKAK